MAPAVGTLQLSSSSSSPMNFWRNWRIGRREVCPGALPLPSRSKPNLSRSFVTCVHHQHTKLPRRPRAHFSVREVQPLFPFRAFLALSAAAVVACLQRRQAGQRSRTRFHQYGERRRNSVMAEQRVDPAPNSRKIDSHLHVWASQEEAKEFPYSPGQDPSLRGNVDFLLQNMSEAGVDGALIVQPINHKFDHSYLSSVIRRHPDKFAGCCLADPTEGGGGVKELERLLVEEGYRAVRFNPYLWPAGQKMTNAVGKAMFSKAGELDAAVGFMCFKGLLQHIDEIEELLSEYPATKVIIDHFGFCKPPQSQVPDSEEAWRRLLTLARFPQVYIKASAFFRVSRESFPFRDTWPLFQRLIETFGADRVLWGSDFPFVVSECGYARANRELPALMASELSLSREDWELVLGKTCVFLFAGAFE